jgi:hypothetical protein
MACTIRFNFEEPGMTKVITALREKPMRTYPLRQRKSVTGENGS